MSTAPILRSADHDHEASARLVISCEHGGNRIPAHYRHFFQAHQAVLTTHRGYDAGALRMARELAAAFDAPLVFATVSRLLVDLNRSVDHRHLHLAQIRSAPASVRQGILRQHYQPYRNEVERLVRQAIADHGRVIHLASHSFTPELNGKVRHADIGLLYDPARPGEAQFCERWKMALKQCAPALVVRRNYPYAGKNDGLARHLRRALPPDTYLAIELEINQKHVAGNARAWARLRQVIVDALRQVLDRAGPDTASIPPPSSPSSSAPASGSRRRQAGALP
ncbi:N-formylglutamate amidohydrolase [Denitromonas iodatirespirans]|uniref:N-formylglutamate amidohydrolase n=1 Tax=Denitromonas iodatirespirans TaxID=2795389 RepID=A0A944DFI7_DENI1|nr:N-formylglutamate amidohydrolase [Denitromonas iodatirespirans]MBT0963433.1 N-formylglutamate amidohydrolase [Denitromonas iodatirespirans]